MALEKQSPCKVNFLLNLLGKRPDGFHELETLMHPVSVYDRLTFERKGSGIQLTCSDPTLPIDSKNLVYRAADLFLKTVGIPDGIRIHLDKHVPTAAGLGGGSGDAAVTLLGMNEVFGTALPTDKLVELAASLGSDIPFFLQNRPAIGVGRGEQIKPLDPFSCLRGKSIILVHPGFGISTPWAYQQMSKFPEAQNGKPGRAEKLALLLANGDLGGATKEFYNSLEAPALKKYPLLVLFQDFFREHGALATLMSGSGSATFAIVDSQSVAEQTLEKFKSHFGEKMLLTAVPLAA
ncbi:MAG: 4-(cytidine 5'-diphospho)-2-C-methyl-D-erythritol kinase [Limisphaerales bacterium]